MISNLLTEFIKRILENSYEQSCDFQEDFQEDIVKKVAKILGYDAGKFLGEGCFSSVFSAREISTGNHVVIKLSKNENEWKGYSMAKDVKGSLPKDLQVHLPVVYFAGQITDFPGLTEEQKASIIKNIDYSTSLIIMEPLKQIDERTSKLFFGRDPRNYSKTFSRIDQMTEEEIILLVNEILNDRELFYIIRENIGFGDTHTSNLILKTLKADHRNLESKILKLKSNELKNQTFMAEIFNVWINSCLSKLDVALDVGAGAIYRFATKLSFMWRRLAIEPRAIDDSSVLRKRKISPTAVEQTFTRLANILYDLGYEFSDMHAMNVMVRSGSGDLVISDLGMFREK